MRNDDDYLGEETQRLDTLARDFIDKRREKERLEKLASKAKEASNAAEMRLWDALEEQNQKTTTLELGEGYGTFQVGRRNTVTAQVLNQEVLEKALESEPGLAEQVLEETHNIRKKVLNQIIRERHKAGKDIPDGADVNDKHFIQLSSK